MDVSPSPLVALPLDPISPRLPIGEPFTPLMAAEAGIGRTVLDRLRREGRVRRLLRGVYVDSTVSSTVPLRARALALVVGDTHVVVGRTAAWLHGVEVSPADPADPGAPVPVEVHGGRGPRRAGRREPRLTDHDLQGVGPVRCTTPLRTALDLGRWLSADDALAALDGLLGLGSFTHTALMAQLPRFGGSAGVVQLRELAALADSRARGAAESVLRLRWLGGRLPTPVPGLTVRTSAGAIRLALGLEVHRFGVVLAGSVTDAGVRALGSAGWRVVVVARERVLRSDPSLVIGHLEREFHQHLLEQVG
jgi:hypothetical protein